MACVVDEGSPSVAPDPAQSMADFCAKLPRPAYSALERVPIGSDWFEAYRVTSGVTAIYEPWQWQEVISYLIEGDDRALLFDTGNGIGDIHAVVEELTPKPIVVLNSHGHYDHVGGNFAFETIYGMDTDFTRQRQAGQTHAQIAVEVSDPALCRPLPAGVSEETHVGRPYAIDHFIKDGHIFDLGGRQLEVLHIPGHTPDAIALIDRSDGLLWTGDSFYAGPIWLFAPETDFDAYADSLARLAKEVPNLQALLPAHNTPWESPQRLIELEQAFGQLKAGRAQAIDQGDGMVEYRLPGVDRFSFLLREGATERRE